MNSYFGFQLHIAICRLSLIGGVLLLAGCAGYGQKMNSTMGAVRSGSLDVALSSLETSNSSADKDLLYFLEKGGNHTFRAHYEKSNLSRVLRPERSCRRT